MKRPATKEKRASAIACSVARTRATGPPPSYPKTRVRGSRLYEAAFILAIIELTRRLHPAYEQAYDKHAVGSVLPQNPDAPAINKLVNEALGKEGCANFAKSILAAVSSEKNPALNGGDLAAIFKLFLDKGGQYTRTLPPGSAGFGNPIGLITSNGGARIAMSSFPDPALQAWSDAVTVIDELFHLAGEKAYYSDYDLAQAIHGLPAE